MEKRTWVSRHKAPLSNDAPPKESNEDKHEDTSPKVGKEDVVTVSSPIRDQNATPTASEKPESIPNMENSSDQWQTVTGKRSFTSPISPAFSDSSPPPFNSFHNLDMVNEIDEIDENIAAPTGITEPTSSNSKSSNSRRKKKRKKGLGKKSPRYT